MAEIPLVLRLKKQMHRDIAKAQDIVVRELYSFFEKAVFHGGTAIWRCYSGNRFSEDVNFYIPKDESAIQEFFESLKKKGFVVKKKKISENCLFSSLELNRTFVRFEALFKQPLPKGSLKEYEAADGNFITVYTLTPEEIIKEKVSAYLNRRKIRDLYDIFFLLRHIKDKRCVSEELNKLIRNFKEPLDEKDLKLLIIEGIAPTAGQIMEYVKGW